jgi:hypothetical protein
MKIKLTNVYVDDQDGWPTQAWFWLEWGSSTARQSYSEQQHPARSAVKIGCEIWSYP